MNESISSRPLGRSILTSAEMRAAEQLAIDGGVSVETLMERAGAAAAEAIWRYAEPLRTLVLCGPGNNGGDGYVIARLLSEKGVEVAVASLGEPRTEAARQARAKWNGAVMSLEEAEPAPLLIDALFGTGLTRGLDEKVARRLNALAAAAGTSIAVDLPSGVSTDDGKILSPVPDFDMTVTFGTLKPAHLLQPSARHMGRLIVGDIGIEAKADLHLVELPKLSAPGPDDHKYSRGYVTVVAGEMPGASGLAACAAARSGAGYVRLIGDRHCAGIPQAVVQGTGDRHLLLKDARIGAVVLGPGLGRGAAAKALAEELIGLDHPLILDADALWLLGNPQALRDAKHMPVLTPHAGEFARLFGALEGSKVDQARRAAEKSGSVVLFKGADTVIAAPDGRAAICLPAPSWLASAGTGDVLTGIIAAMRARGLPAFEAACAGAWLHMRAAQLAGPWLIADDLVATLPAALAECL